MDRVSFTNACVVGVSFRGTQLAGAELLERGDGVVHVPIGPDHPHQRDGPSRRGAERGRPSAAPSSRSTLMGEAPTPPTSTARTFGTVWYRPLEGTFKREVDGYAGQKIWADHVVRGDVAGDGDHDRDNDLPERRYGASAGAWPDPT